MPTTRAAGAAVTRDGHVYVIGGIEDNGVRKDLSTDVPLPSMTVFNASINEWDERMAHQCTLGISAPPSSMKASTSWQADDPARR
ncbi:unnamed protein product [Vitrella brassicaformis CCMP3155]|uniref:Uncharacterized protein n=1 Tax=Vitrella brassicaformis (strain CCMP3155) TaxID=1169540 RepID=A0A0G4GBC0_VITBC|nr:unnamed protein product [Vitrella brassicaformis CCMP3155]|eukprot:CEM25966.1 unnamed protein product [Vitrella brassicaformis CCMP3155]